MNTQYLHCTGVMDRRGGMEEERELKKEKMIDRER